MFNHPLAVYLIFLSFLLCLFYLLSVLALFVRADDAELEVNDASASAEEVHEYDETTEETQEPVMYITAAPDVSTTIYFPSNNQLKPGKRKKKQ